MSHSNLSHHSYRFNTMSSTNFDTILAALKNLNDAVESFHVSQAKPSSPVAVVAPAPAPAPKKRGAKKLADMTDEERSAHEAKKAARKAAKDSSAPSAPSDSASDSNASLSSKKTHRSMWNAYADAVWTEMKEAYFLANPSARNLSVANRKAKIKSNELPVFPSYRHALEEASARRCAKNEDHAKMHRDYREKVDSAREMKKGNASSLPIACT